MKSIKISLEISSPILVPKYPIHLDALLYASLNLNTNLSNKDILVELSKVLESEDGIFKASAIRYLRTQDRPIYTTEWSFVTRTHWTEWKYSSHEREKSIITKGGGFRKRVTAYNAINSSSVEFHAIGNAKQIRYLLENLGFIGLGNSQGFGEITGIEIEEDEDFTFFDEDGELARVLPAHMVAADDHNRYLKIINSVKPPYESTERIESLIPNFRLKTLWN